MRDMVVMKDAVAKLLIKLASLLKKEDRAGMEDRRWEMGDSKAARRASSEMLQPL